jgi:hypothetical protein
VYRSIFVCDTWAETWCCMTGNLLWNPSRNYFFLLPDFSQRTQLTSCIFFSFELKQIEISFNVVHGLSTKSMDERCFHVWFDMLTYGYMGQEHKIANYINVLGYVSELNFIYCTNGSHVTYSYDKYYIYDLKILLWILHPTNICIDQLIFIRVKLVLLWYVVHVYNFIFPTVWTFRHSY